MPTAKGGYYTRDKVRVPSVTTVISNCKIGGIDPLLHWANTEGLAGRNFRETRDKAADAGTCAHARVYAHVHKQQIEAKEFGADAWVGSEAPFYAFKAWEQQTKMELVAGEVALISEAHKYGGTLDAIAINEKLILVDYKTSNGIYPEYLIQVRAYGELWNENNPDYKVEGYMLLRFSKQETPEQPISFSTHYWEHLDPAWEAFKHMRELYELNKILRRMS